MTIPMQPRHIALIKEGRKTSTLRSIGELYSIGVHELKDGTLIEIKSRDLLYVFDEGAFFELNPNNTIILDWLVPREGYSSWPEVVAGLRGMRHKLPKRMWLYTFEVCK